MTCYLADTHPGQDGLFKGLGMEIMSWRHQYTYLYFNTIYLAIYPFENNQFQKDKKLSAKKNAEETEQIKETNTNKTNWTEKYKESKEIEGIIETEESVVKEPNLKVT